MKPVDFGSIGQGVQGIVTAIGVIAAGTWAVFIFKDLGSEQQAQAALAVAQQKLDREPAIEFAMSPTVSRTLGGKDLDLDLIVNVKNVGTSDAGFDSMAVSLLRLGPDGHPINDQARPIQVDQQWIGPNLKFSDEGSVRVIRPGQSRNIAFPFPVLRPGRYFVQLNCAYGSVDSNTLQLTNFDPISAFEQTILEVR